MQRKKNWSRQDGETLFVVPSRVGPLPPSAPRIDHTTSADNLFLSLSVCRYLWVGEGEGGASLLLSLSLLQGVRKEEKKGREREKARKIAPSGERGERGRKKERKLHFSRKNHPPFSQLHLMLPSRTRLQGHISCFIASHTHKKKKNYPESPFSPCLGDGIIFVGVIS